MSYKDGEEVRVLFKDTPVPGGILHGGVVPYFVIGDQQKRGGKLMLKQIKTRGWDTSEYPDLLIHRKRVRMENSLKR